MYNNTSAPIIQQQELTMQCNNNCQFCYNPERCQTKFRPCDEDRKRNLHIAEISVNQGVMAVCPTGGEPLLAENHLFEIMSIYRQAGCYLSLNSNGRLITLEISERLAKSGLSSCLISIHGTNSLHDEMVGTKDAFGQTINGIINLRKSGVSVTPNFVACAKNIHGLLDLGKTLAKFDIEHMTVTPFLPSWGSYLHEQFVMQKQHYKIYFETVQKIKLLGVKIDSTLPIPPCVLIGFFPEKWQDYTEVLSPRVCMAGKSFGVVSPDGFFRACIQAPNLTDFGDDMCKNYQQSWQKANLWAEKKLLPQECLDCEALDICGGGCRTSSLWENKGEIKGKTMYMGKSLTKEQANIFKKRTLVKIPRTEKFYCWQSEIKMRDEIWGMIIFNPKNQSFTILSSQIKENLPLDKKIISFSLDKTARVLQAIGVIRPVADFDKEKEIINIPSSVYILSPNLLLPRLGQSLNVKDDIYCLRADTGERYFF